MAETYYMKCPLSNRIGPGNTRPITDVPLLANVVRSVDYFGFNIFEPVGDLADRYGANVTGFFANQGNVFFLVRQFVNALEGRLVDACYAVQERQKLGRRRHNTTG